MSELIEKLQAAKVKVAINHPYIVTALLSMRFVESEAVPTMGVDKRWNCYYNKASLEKWTVQETATVLEHEIWHLLRNHCDDTRKPKLGPHGKPATDSTIANIWNIATDCEINDDLAADEHNKLPSGCYYPKTINMPEHLTAEEYYESEKIQVYDVDASWAAADDQETKDKLSGKEVDQGQNGNQPGQGGSKPGKSGNPGSSVGKSGKGAGKLQHVAPGFGGSCSDGVDRKWEVTSIGGKPQEHLSPMEKAIIAKSVAKAIKETQGRGNLPAGIERWADETLREQVVPWNKELASIIKGNLASLSGLGDVTYSKRHRRASMIKPFVRPAPYRLIPTITVVVDTSGSVSDKMLSQALTEVHGILKRNDGMGVIVLSCDAAVHSAKKVFNRHQVDLLGAGGTDMCVGIDKAMEYKPHVCVLITDGFTPYPEDAPNSYCRFVTLVLAEGGDVPKFGKVVKVNITD